MKIITQSKITIKKCKKLIIYLILMILIKLMVLDQMKIPIINLILNENLIGDNKDNKEKQINNNINIDNVIKNSEKDNIPNKLNNNVPIKNNNSCHNILWNGIG